MRPKKNIIIAGFLLSTGAALLVHESFGVRALSFHPYDSCAEKVSKVRSQLEPREVVPVIDGFESTADVQIRSLLDRLETITDSEDLAKMIEREIGECRNPGEWLAALTRLGVVRGGSIYQEVFLALVRPWAEADPHAVADFLSRLPESSVRRDGSEQLAIAWANADLPQAVSWAAGIQEDATRQTAVLALARETMRDAPFTAIELAGLLPPSSERDACLSQAIGQWASTDHTGALSWATEEADPLLRQQLLAATALAAAETSPQFAAAVVSQYIDVGEAQDRAAIAVVERWGQTDPEGAAQWLEQFPHVRQRAIAAESLASVWATTDASGAWDWLTGLSDEVMRRTAIRGYTAAAAHFGGRR